MSTPDPQTVRDFARRAILSSAEDVDYCGIGEQFGDEEAWPNEEAAYDAMLAAVYAEQQKATVTVSWPDEQQPADVVTAEQQQDGAAEAVRRFAKAWDYGNDVVSEDRYAPLSTLAIGEHTGGTARMTPPQLLAVLAERTALAARVAELEGEREADTARPRRVCLCGSTRFRAEFDAANRTLTLAGYIVLAPGVFAHSDGVPITEAEKTALDALHFAKIDLADEVFVVNPGGYIGSSTANEIAYAAKRGTPVRYLVEES